MAIGEICSREVVFIARNDSCAQAARLMREHHVGSLVVVRDASSPRVPVGMITDRDLAVGVMALGLDPEKTLVEAAMRPQLDQVRDGRSHRALRRGDVGARRRGRTGAAQGACRAARRALGSRPTGRSPGRLPR